jgi:hypothetical protein
MKTYNERKKEVEKMKDGPKKELLKQCLEGQEECIRLEKRYQKLRPKLSKEERERLDKLSGWFEHQDN